MMHQPLKPHCCHNKPNKPKEREQGECDIFAAVPQTLDPPPTSRQLNPEKVQRVQLCAPN